MDPSWAGRSKRNTKSTIDKIKDKLLHFSHEWQKKKLKKKKIGLLTELNHISLLQTTSWPTTRSFYKKIPTCIPPINIPSWPSPMHQCSPLAYCHQCSSIPSFWSWVLNILTKTYQTSGHCNIIKAFAWFSIISIISKE